MERLSSCYFCGAALDASLDEYPVVPAALRPGADAQKTVVLCRPCSQKLDAVLETVVDAVEKRSESSLDRDAESGANAGLDTDAGPDIERTLAGDPDLLSPVSRSNEGPRRNSEPQDESRSTSERDATRDEQKADESAPDEQTAEPADADPLDSGSETRAGGATTDDGGPSGGESDGDRAASGGEDRSSSGGTGAPDDEREESTEQKEDVSLTRLENTKVMRLLENREFPVDQAEFVTVAANAYQISRDDCEKILSLADQHGLVSIENGQIRAGDR